VKFRGIKQIVSEANAWREVSDALRDLFTGIYKLTFADNFESFEVTNITIAAGETKTFANPLGVIPTKYLIARNSAGMPIGDNGLVNWTATTVTLKNSGASSTIITAIFLR
jgi:hypothetical protein